jgi:methionyl aminopeptidase
MNPKTAEEIQNIRESGRLLAIVLQRVAKSAIPGIRTDELDQIARDELARLDGDHAFLDYQGFPGVICISVNDAVVHGIPDHYVLQNGDVVGLDYGVNYRGMITDSAVTVGVGTISKEAARLIKVTEQSMYTGIDQVKNGAHVGDIGSAVEEVLKRANLGIVRQLTGHGVGHEVHEQPAIPNFGVAGKGPILKTGMTIAIEPMATLGGDPVIFESDGWTVSTADHSLGAHFEHTVLVAEDGYEILTQW